MEKLNTIQKRNKLDEVYRAGDIGPGGAYHDYMIEQKIPVDVPGLLGESHYTNIPFQRGARKDPDSQHGVLDVDLLEIVRDRLMCFQKGDYACRENELALMHIEEALLWMNKRVEDRAERGVLGTEEK